MVRLSYMDDTKSLPQQPVASSLPPAQQVNDQITQTPVVAPVQPVQQPVSPISGGNKEHGPVGRVSEYVTPHHTEVAPTIPQEVREAGVEPIESVEQPNVPQEAKQAGVEPAKESVPVTFSDQPVASVLPTPMNYPEAVKEIQGNPANSKTWLGMLSKYVLEKFGMQKTI